MITTSNYYYHALRYVYQNPLRAKIVSDVRDYKFSTLALSTIPITSVCNGLEEKIPKEKNEFLSYLNNKYSDEESKILQNAITKTKMSWSSQIKRELKDVLIDC